MNPELFREIGISDTLLLVRVDFEHPAAWRRLLDEPAVPSPPEGFRPNFRIVDDPRWSGVTADLAVNALRVDGAEPTVPFLFLVDRATVTGSEHAVVR